MNNRGEVVAVSMWLSAYVDDGRIADRMAEAILNDYMPRPRTIRTRGDFDSLPDYSLLREQKDFGSFVYERNGDLWRLLGSGDPEDGPDFYSSEDLERWSSRNRIEVIYTPEVEA